MNAAIYSLIGIVVGGALQYFFTRHPDNLKHYRELRTKSYTDYLKNVSDQSNLGIRPQSPETRELCGLMQNLEFVCMDQLKLLKPLRNLKGLVPI